MTSSPLDSFTAHKDLIDEVNECGGQRAFSRKHGVARTTLQDRLAQLKEAQFKHRPAPEAVVMAQGSGRRRVILGCAQDASRVHESFLTNLEAYCEWLEEDAPCEIVIAGITYNKTLFEDHAKDKTPIFHKRVQPYLRHERLRLCEGLDFVGEANTLPTATHPLSGFETYTRHRWGAFPHPKLQLVSVPTQKHLPAKINLTTGAVTLPNYIPKRAGIRASFHHQIAALLVEIDDDEEFFCRHLIAAEDGSFYDLDRHISKGEVTTGHRIEALTPGDLHVPQLDPLVAKATFGFWPTGYDAQKGYIWEGGKLDGTILGVLRPHHIFAHDVTDFRARNSHELRDPHARFKHYVSGRETVEAELQNDSLFLTHLDKLSDAKLHAVNSNHHNQLEKWIKGTSHHEDPANAVFYLKCALACYEAMERGENLDIYAFVMKNMFGDWDCADVHFMGVDESCIIGDVEHGNHGHHGANGAKGSIRSFVRGGAKTTSGHTHSAAILDGAYVAGTSSNLDLGYNVGMSSWSHSHVIQYLDGRRTIITLKNGRWKI